MTTVIVWVPAIVLAALAVAVLVAFMIVAADSKWDR